MTWVKICGITNLEDALVAVDAGADAVGFVFYEKSPRFVSVETAREIIARLPQDVEKVGVFVGTEPEDVAAVSSQTGLSAAQVYLHSRPSPQMDAEFIRRSGCRMIPALSAGTLGQEELIGFAVPDGAREAIPAMLIDSGSSDRPGGTGKRLPSGLLAEFSATAARIGLKFILAGGLNAENVSEAIRSVHPWGVDVASGVEARPGKKDPEKVRAFVKAVREYDAKVS